MYPPPSQPNLGELNFFFDHKKKSFGKLSTSNIDCAFLGALLTHLKAWNKSNFEFAKKNPLNLHHKYYLPQISLYLLKILLFAQNIIVFALNTTAFALYTLYTTIFALYTTKFVLNATVFA